MEAKEKVVLSEVISGMKLQFYIPVFQRNYSWNEKNCERLFNDILDLTDDKTKSHFIGSFVYKLNKFIDTQYNQFVLIDGQQRLTSLTLILKALNDYLKQFGEEYKDLMDEISEGYLYNKFAKDEKLRLKLKPNKDDDENFNYLMNNDLDSIKKDSLIYQNYKYFYNRINSMQCTIDDFYNALQRLEGVSITLDEQDNPQLIFESLNSTGMDLNDVDLIRNFLLMNCKPEEQDRLYKEYWIKLEQKLDNNFTGFVRDFLSLKNGTVTQDGKNKVYFAFRKYYDKINYGLEDFLSEWINYSQTYCMLLYPLIKTDKKTDIQKALNDTIELNMKTTYPFLLGIMLDYNNNLIDKENTVKIIRLIESYGVRRSICGVQGGALSMQMASLYKELLEKYKNNFYDDTYIKVATKMASVNTNAYFPKDEQFKEEFTRRDMYTSKLRKYILDRLESFGQNKEVVNTDNLTIEHVMPYTLNKEWEKYLNIEDVEEFHEQYKNRIGNLTLTAYNSEMSQKLFNEKKIHVEFSRLFLNKYFLNVETWNKSEIDARGLELFKIAKKIWVFPDVVPQEGLSSESYNILLDDEDYDFTNTKPIKYIFNDDEYHVTSWAELYLSILKKIYQNNSEQFVQIVLNDQFGGASKKLFGLTSEGMRSDNNVSDSLYCETNLNTMKKIKILKELFNKLELDTSGLIVYIIPT